MEYRSRFKSEHKGVAYNLDYSSRSKRFALRHPLLSDIRLQIIYWVVAFLLYFILLNFVSKGIVSLFDPNAKVHMTENVIIAVIGAIIFGTILGLIDYHIERRFIRKSLGRELFAKFSLYSLAWFILLSITRIIGIAVEAKFIDNTDIKYTQLFFSSIGISSTVYTMFMIAGISFIKQMNTKFGPGMLLPMILGRYRKPREEKRIFMFMDLKSSTKYAEDLGHLKYSEMIQACFRDVNKVLPKYFAEIYQYVGDEVVLTWLKEEGLHKLNCIKFYFAFSDLLKLNKSKYEKNFGLVPEFKASIHLGKIIAAEVGDIKREIAYHGDTINTASRIQALCNLYDKKLLISETVKNEISNYSEYNIEFVDETILKGKTKGVKLYSVEEIVSH